MGTFAVVLAGGDVKITITGSNHREIKQLGFYRNCYVGMGDRLGPISNIFKFFPSFLLHLELNHSHRTKVDIFPRWVVTCFQLHPKSKHIPHQKILGANVILAIIVWLVHFLFLCGRLPLRTDGTAYRKYPPMHWRHSLQWIYTYTAHVNSNGSSHAQPCSYCNIICGLSIIN